MIFQIMKKFIIYILSMDSQFIKFKIKLKENLNKQRELLI